MTLAMIMAFLRRIEDRLVRMEEFLHWWDPTTESEPLEFIDRAADGTSQTSWQNLPSDGTATSSSASSSATSSVALAILATLMPDRNSTIVKVRSVANQDLTKFSAMLKL